MAAEIDEYLERALDPSLTNEMAAVFGNSEPAPAEKAFYDNRLRGTGVYAYYVRPDEITELHSDRNLSGSALAATVPYIGLNPDLLKMPKDFACSVIDHEKCHGAQPKGKLSLLSIHAYTPFGAVPLGKMFVEGWNEYGLEKRQKPPSRYFDEMHGYGNTDYSQYRDFVYEVEQKLPGITRQIVKAARKGGPNSAIRLMEGIPDIDRMVAKYARSLNSRN